MLHNVLYANRAVHCQLWKLALQGQGGDARMAALQEYCLEDLQAAGLAGRLSEVHGIAAAAAEELALERALQAMEAAWEGVRIWVAGSQSQPLSSLRLGSTTHIQVLWSLEQD